VRMVRVRGDMMTDKLADTEDALRACLMVMAYYHKGEAPGDEDACEAPDQCMHCLVTRQARAVLGVGK